MPPRNATVLVPTTVTVELDPIAGIDFVDYDPAEPIPAEHRDAIGLVAWRNSAAQLAEAAAVMPNLRLVQLLSAGTDVADDAGFAPSVTIASGRGLHDGPVAEHTLALVLAAARGLHETMRDQDARRWVNGRNWLTAETGRHAFTTLRGAQVVIWGYGSIASTLAPLLAALGATVIGVARTARTDGDVQIVTPDRLPGILPTTDVLIDLLPATTETDGIIGADVFAQLPPHAWLVNVGRGSTVDEDALLTALRSGHIGGAALDVFRTEPLPTDSPLWAEPNVIVTPHAAGGRPLGAADLIRHNVMAMLAGDPVTNAVER
ncbi:NAD(P)-dependent oxidoreductase [Salinibacterium hongtaonis]|uniref:NAD(P)-dependent oxidoreductase n=1 Tax=Homoserinimonas hongtaonis TaxID=2079791 RepID=UPI000D3CFD8B|nr:NAD(P)-dependent oxidoreductase [Salinibacterium hongtaonis]AWB89801.1 phosphoglycerate dehydrogenase [Salinibacterium hongtaonis]